MIPIPRAGLPATLFALVLGTVLVGSGLIFDRMAAVDPPPPARVALLDRPPPARVEPGAGAWETVHPVLGTLVLESQPARVAARSAHENAPSRAHARRGERKKPAEAVFGPQPPVEPAAAHDDGLQP